MFAIVDDVFGETLTSVLVTALMIAPSLKPEAMQTYLRFDYWTEHYDVDKNTRLIGLIILISY